MKRKMVLLGAFALALTLNLKLSSNVNSNSKTDKGISSICSNVMAKAEDDDDDDDDGGLEYISVPCESSWDENGNEIPSQETGDGCQSVNFSSSCYNECWC
ncbi:MAG: hypothetical protein KA327_07650 [Pseudarcicella sp.]|nr:hypothetical protein [Pseudarcicella sp.]